eukprot:CAMPEP_0178453228 /NCGR_PEP_ID=MMETSP0689_2-20121128/44695_1 /TAXON_ID=160604 /ORGANISM="Amphidinium massartii, Strain CS-259" /LENGTH=1077 /DNA_ID=CAMNT_0020079045 /DNA_START=56 /DNA_END=3286 /DNA_ORIENTATION=-
MSSLGIEMPQPKPGILGGHLFPELHLGAAARRASQLQEANLAASVKLSMQRPLAVTQDDDSLEIILDTGGVFEGFSARCAALEIEAFLLRERLSQLEVAEIDCHVLSGIDQSKVSQDKPKVKPWTGEERERRLLAEVEGVKAQLAAAEGKQALPNGTTTRAVLADKLDAGSPSAGLALEATSVFVTTVDLEEGTLEKLVDSPRLEASSLSPEQEPILRKTPSTSSSQRGTASAPLSASRRWDATKRRETPKQPQSARASPLPRSTATTTASQAAQPRHRSTSASGRERLAKAVDFRADRRLRQKDEPQRASSAVKARPASKEVSTPQADGERALLLPGFASQKQSEACPETADNRTWNDKLDANIDQAIAMVKKLEDLQRAEAASKRSLPQVEQSLEDPSTTNIDAEDASRPFLEERSQLQENCPSSTMSDRTRAEADAETTFCKESSSIEQPEETRHESSASEADRSVAQEVATPQVHEELLREPQAPQRVLEQLQQEEAAPRTEETASLTPDEPSTLKLEETGQIEENVEQPDIADGDETDQMNRNEEDTEEKGEVQEEGKEIHEEAPAVLESSTRDQEQAEEGSNMDAEASREERPWSTQDESIVSEAPETSHASWQERWAAHGLDDAESEVDANGYESEGVEAECGENDEYNENAPDEADEDAEALQTQDAADEELEEDELADGAEDDNENESGVNTSEILDDEADEPHEDEGSEVALLEEDEEEVAADDILDEEEVEEEDPGEETFEEEDEEEGHYLDHGGESGEDQEEFEDSLRDLYRNGGLSLSEQCPCSSGLPFSQCHFVALGLARQQQTAAPLQAGRCILPQVPSGSLVASSSAPSPTALGVPSVSPVASSPTASPTAQAITRGGVTFIDRTGQEVVPTRSFTSSQGVWTTASASAITARATPATTSSALGRSVWGASPSTSMASATAATAPVRNTSSGGVVVHCASGSGLGATAAHPTATAQVSLPAGCSCSSVSAARPESSYPTAAVTAAAQVASRRVSAMTVPSTSTYSSTGHTAAAPTHWAQPQQASPQSDPTMTARAHVPASPLPHPNVGVVRTVAAAATATA